MKNHAAIVSSFGNGKVRLYTDKVNEAYQNSLPKKMKNSVFSYEINSGVVEFNNDKGIILCE
jgi:F-type H+-transporting ATPase subunit epsilon